MLFGDIVDKFHDKHGLTYSRTSEQTDLTAFGIRAQKVDDLDSGLEDLFI